MGKDNTDDPFASRDATVYRPRPGAGKRGPDRPTAAEPRIAMSSPGRSALPGALRDFTAPGLNPLVQAASALLLLAGRLRISTGNPDVPGLRRQALDQIRDFEERARSAGIPQETVLAARYVLCGALDEAVLSAPWGGQSEWAAQTLAVKLHGDPLSGRKFFEMLEGTWNDPARHINLMELQYFCLALGFAGKYGVAERGYARLAEIQADLFRRIRAYRGVSPPELSLHWQGMQDRRNPLIRYVPWWVVGAFTLAVLSVTFIIYHTRLGTLSAPISERLNHIGLAAPVPTDVASAAPRLKQILHDDVVAGLLTVTERNNQSVVTLVATDLFTSGSATVNPKYRDLLDRVAHALNEVPGRVFVVGHTDDQPVRSLKYRDNYDLSRARAQEVLQKLSGTIDNKARLEASGVADSEPLCTPASLPEKRACNRRVEIIHVAEG